MNHVEKTSDSRFIDDSKCFVVDPVYVDTNTGFNLAVHIGILLEQVVNIKKIQNWRSVMER